MDVGLGHAYPANALSNFSPHTFHFDGVLCNSMEGFLQSLKFEKVHIQEEVCKLVGRAAKVRGRNKNKTWQRQQTLWWKGKPYMREGKPYQDLLYKAYHTMFEQSESFRRALKASGQAIFSHSIGHNKVQQTVLTEREFCSFLTAMRNLL
jgi:predicted NAD-dependent protein-ADP-ribosyltransferase YbiA (DUF1768 family)